MHPLGSHLHALRALPPLRLPHARDGGEVRAGTLGHSSSSCYSCNAWWTAAIAIDPSPTADAARLTMPLRTSPPAVGRRTPWARSDCTVALCEDGEDVVACARRMGDVTLLVRPRQPPVADGDQPATLERRPQYAVQLGTAALRGVQPHQIGQVLQPDPRLCCERMGRRE